MWRNNLEQQGQWDEDKPLGALLGLANLLAHEGTERRGLTRHKDIGSDWDVLQRETCARGRVAAG
jgi:hypothetical protein